MKACIEVMVAVILFGCNITFDLVRPIQGIGDSGSKFLAKATNTVVAAEKSVRKAEQLAGVGCESCHGPGGKYVEVFEEILKSKRKYKAEELQAIGLAKVSEATCKTCHNQEGPT